MDRSRGANRNQPRDGYQQDRNRQPYDNYRREEEYLPPHYYHHSQYYQPPQPQVQHHQQVATDISQSTLTMKQIGTMLTVVGSLAAAGIGGWNSLNRELDTQKTSLAQFREVLTKDIANLETTIQEIKHVNNETRLANEKSNEAFKQQLNDMDQSLSQIYQKISGKNKE